MSQQALVLSGAGRYSDPWHPFAETSAHAASIIDDAGFTVTVSEDVDGRLSDLSSIDLLVLNIGASKAPYAPGVEAIDEGSRRDADSRDGLLAYLGSGRPLLALHVSATSLEFVPEWERILGGIWVRGTSMHPDYSLAQVRIDAGAHPIVEGLSDFQVYDERYTHLRVDPEVGRLAWHDQDGAEHPLLWTHGFGSARVVYDALGHDARSYESEEGRELISRSARWLVGALD